MLVFAVKAHMPHTEAGYAIPDFCYILLCRDFGSSILERY